MFNPTYATFDTLKHVAAAQIIKVALRHVPRVSFFEFDCLRPISPEGIELRFHCDNIVGYRQFSPREIEPPLYRELRALAEEGGAMVQRSAQPCSVEFVK